MNDRDAAPGDPQQRFAGRPPAADGRAGRKAPPRLWGTLAVGTTTVMDSPIMPTPDRSPLLAKRSVEEAQGLPPQPAEDLHRLRAIFAVVVVLGAIVSVCVVVASLV
jgi:hypothetical protein